MTKSKVLKFAVPCTSMQDVFALQQRVMSDGKRLLNSKPWRGKEARSCAVTNLKSRSHSAGQPFTLEVEVTYRPKGHISYFGQTRYDGWDLAPLDQSADGTRLDGAGKPLKEGAPPVYLSFEIFNDTDFNELDLGEFLGEWEQHDVARMTMDDLWSEVFGSGKPGESGRWSATIQSDFVAPRRNRPLAKIILTNASTQNFTDGFGTQIKNINIKTENLEHVLMDEIYRLLCDFMEGRLSLKTIGNDRITFVELSDALVDCEPNEMGLDSWFQVLHMYTPAGFLEDLAKRIEALYAVEVAIIEGKECGVVLKRSSAHG